VAAWTAGWSGVGSSSSRIGSVTSRTSPRCQSRSTASQPPARAVTCSARPLSWACGGAAVQAGIRTRNVIAARPLVTSIRVRGWSGKSVVWRSVIERSVHVTSDGTNKLT
jgi:hypothetical protein